MSRLHKLAIVGASGAGKTEAALAHALMAARRGPVLFICDNDEVARLHRQQAQMEPAPKPIVFCGLGRFVMLSAFSEPFQTMVIDTAMTRVTANQVLIFASRAAQHHGEAWIVQTHATPS
ncbi:hypothetical protein VQH23_21000 [Pararoseomonas sp. SCSIO 73927]|uniref:hypothetical protein n=1 Tax=Pararoseomonas sp. SCSIO 73927 TaxID=3114537 RepID=UPI0030CB03B5